MSPDVFRDRLLGLTVWQHGGVRAPHKPLLLLYALARFAEGVERLPYHVVERDVTGLLRDFGPARPKHQVFSFWRLQTDAVWTVEPATGLTFTASGDPTVTSLRAVDPVGRFPDAVAALLQRDPALLGEAAHALLDAHFPASVHDDLLTAVGLDPDALTAKTPRRRRRDPAFREAVLRAYGYRCAVCGFETRVGTALVGVDAAHVMWHQAGGADAVSNGVALCALHHRLLDRGAYTLAPTSSRETVVEVAEAAHGGPGFEAWLLAFHGRPLAEPAIGTDRVAEPSAAWHRREVFQGRARPYGSVNEAVPT